MKIDASKSIPYTVNTTGAIELSSIKNKSIFNIAQKYDTDKNNILEYNEIKNFLKEFGAIDENGGYSVYYESKDKNGKLIKRSLLTKNDNSQITFFYKNNQPVKCVLKKTDGEEHIMDLTDGSGTLFPANGPKYACYKYELDKTNLNGFKNLGMGKRPFGNSNPIIEFITKLFNWNW